MSEEWLIETLTDLQAYAEEHHLRALAAHLDQAIALAHLETACGNMPCCAAPPDDTPQ